MRAGVLCIASGKGGVGKSVLAANLACMRAAAGERVCLVDFDAGLANAHLLFGLAPKHDLGSILDGTVTAEEVAAATSAMLQVTVPFASEQPADAETKATCEGNVSVMMTSVASPGPRLLTVSV